MLSSARPVFASRIATVGFMSSGPAISLPSSLAATTKDPGGITYRLAPLSPPPTSTPRPADLPCGGRDGEHLDLLRARAGADQLTGELGHPDRTDLAEVFRQLARLEIPDLRVEALGRGNEPGRGVLHERPLTLGDGGALDGRAGIPD